MKYLKLVYHNSQKVDILSSIIYILLISRHNLFSQYSIYRIVQFIDGGNIDGMALFSYLMGKILMDGI